MHIQECQIGQSVSFGRPNGEKTEGTIIKVNRKTIKIRQDGARGTTKAHSVGTVWTCPPSLATLLTATATATAERSEREILKELAVVTIKLNITITRTTLGERGLRRKAARLRAELGREVSDGEIWILILKGVE